MKTLHLGNCLEVLRGMPDCSVDAVVTDPPYGLSFMGKKWDYDVPGVEVWAECLRVLKPGGHLLAFAGTRTQHRMAVRIEDAGFEIRDMIAWVYGSGFPKSLDVSKAIDKAAGAERNKVLVPTKPGNTRNDRGVTYASESHARVTDISEPVTPEAQQWSGWGTALKPALEPITVARKPLAGTVAENVLAHGTGALNVDGCRVEALDGRPLIESRAEKSTNAFGDGLNGSRCAGITTEGRWPANLIHDGSDEVVGLFPQSKAPKPYEYAGKQEDDAEIYGKGIGRGFHNSEYGDTGSAARFFYCARQDVSTPEVGYNETWQDQNQNQSSALTVGQSLSPLKAVGDIVQKAVATWQSLEGILSNAQSEAFTSVTQSELKTIKEVVTATIASIGSGFLPAQQLEKPTPCGSLVKCAAMKEPTGITTITTSLCKSDGCAAVVTSSITQTNLERGVAASRFNYCAKASKSDRDEGLEGFAKTSGGFVSNTSGQHMTRRDDGYQVAPRANTHPTVKPTELMRYLCRLVTPPGGVVLDPFMGSGSTGKAALLEGFKFVGIERDPAYFEIANARIKGDDQMSLL